MRTLTGVAIGAGALVALGLTVAGVMVAAPRQVNVPQPTVEVVVVTEAGSLAPAVVTATAPPSYVSVPVTRTVTQTQTSTQPAVNASTRPPSTVTETRVVERTVTAPPSVTTVTQVEYVTPPSTADSAPVNTATVNSSPPVSTGAYYASCDQAYAAGTSQIPSTDPAYRPELDGDHNGIACQGR